MKTKLGAALLGFSYMTLGLIPAYAADTDIFLGKGSEDELVRPNVLFILDNSTSMTNTVDGRGSPTRLQSMKDSMRTILASVEGINAGFMRFNDPGGSILYPVDNLDRALDEYWKLHSSTEESHDDAQQSLGGVSSINLSGEELTLGALPSNLQTKVYSISVDGDDASQWETCNWGGSNCQQQVSVGSNPIIANKDRFNGFRFQGIDIPHEAYIHSAQLHFRATNNGNDDLDLVLRAENVGNSAAFNASNRTNITDRTPTDEMVVWHPGNWSSGQDYSSPDLSSLVSKIIDLPDWVAGNALTIIQTAEGDGSRSIASRETNSNQAARLEVQFQGTGGGVYESQHVGLRFQNVSIPQGAIIKRAYLEVTSSSSKSSATPVELSIAVQNTPNADAFDNGTNLAVAGAATISPIINWDAYNWEQDETIRSPSLIEPLQALVNDADWCGGNAVAFHITPRGSADSSRTFYSADHGVGRAPRLVVEYDPSSVPESSCNQVVLRFPISKSANDAKERISNGAMDNNEADLPLDKNHLVGLRFENLPIKKDAEIVDARLVFTSGKNNSGTSSTTFKVQDSVAPPNFPEGNNNKENISKRSLRNNAVVWGSNSEPALINWVENNKYRSPNLASLVTPIVNKSQWNANSNALVFVLSSTGERSARSVDWGAGGAPVLEIKLNVDSIEGGLSDGRTVRDHLAGLIDDFDVKTYTPIVDTLYEAALYYRGDNVDWGKKRWSGGGGGTSRTSIDQRWKRVSHIDSIEEGTGELFRPGCSEDDLDNTNCRNEEIIGSPKYKSPIVEACQANYIVLLTDGVANNNSSADRIKSLIGHSGSCQNSKGGETCSEELVEWMATNDMASNVDGNNNVHTFTIAFALNDTGAQNYLNGLAQKGGGRHFSAGSEAELTNAFNTIIGEIIDRSSTFVVPGTTVSQFNRLSHYEDIFFSVFKPSRHPRWAGNLKKYKISDTNDNYGRIVGQNDKPAVDESTGFFKENVTSFWSDTSDPDGPDVEKGGAAAKLPTNLNDRKVLTYYEDASKRLTDTQNRLLPSNEALTRAMLDIADRDDAYRTSLLNWARGQDVFDENSDNSTTDARQQMGDSLHSAPVVIPYGGTEEDPDFTVFFGTNDGFLRAVNGKTGVEHFAFIPEALLPNLKTLYDNITTDPHPYGVDGDITRWVHDGDGDPTTAIGTHEKDFAYIYFGLRRGGNHYYALDVTDRNNPKLMWHIDGSVSPFDEMGESWSQPLKAKVKVKGKDDKLEEKDVLIFGGGYDPDQDYAPTRQTDKQGRAIFMVEAGPPESGTVPELIWSAGPSVAHRLQLDDMKYAIPSLIRAGDTNGDGFVDVMFAADMGGQIWRFDVNNGQSAASLVTGGVIAEFAANNNPAAARRFYGGVDAATIAHRGERFIALTAGSGTRENPLSETVEDRFYMIRQPIAKPATYTKLTEDDLYDATDDYPGNPDLDEEETAEVRKELAEKEGWYIRLEDKGEKVLAPSITAQTVVHFTTYRPGGDRKDPCSPAAGTSFFYAVNIIDASPAFRNKSGDVTRRDELDSGNIAPTPTVIVLPDGTTRTLVGPEEMGPTLFGDPVHKTYWFENQ